MKNKQTFGYAIEMDGELMSVGRSRSWDLQTLGQLRPDADYADPDTRLIRVPLSDEIKTEYGFMTRAAYLEIKNNQK
jgi:hypothetical protein